MMKKLLMKTYEYSLAIISIIVLVLNVLLAFFPILIIGLIKIIPIKPLRRLCSRLLDGIVSVWISINSGFISLTRKIEWEVHGDNNLSKRQWYLVISNHQSWLDIVVLQKILNHRIPMLKFFIKSQLKWLPLFGFAWWAIDCPFMKRYSKEYLKKFPHKRGLDLQATKKACEKFKNMPVSIMNFIEGTRFTKEKHTNQDSPYRNLLKPKAGGIAYVLNSMNQQINTILDITILYPKNHRTLWDYLCGRVKKIKIFIKQIQVPEQFMNLNYYDANQKKAFHNWLNSTWKEKDALLQNEENLLSNL